MWRLKSLRHLITKNAMKYLPEGMGKLTSLRTLNYFPLCKETEGSCKIEELKDLNHLEGKLMISGLDGMKTENEALEARLKNKRHLRILEFEFTRIEGSMNSFVVDTMKNVLNGLQPHAYLEELSLNFYLDSKFPSWIEDYSLLSHLKVLRLYWCINCIEILVLGTLPSLEELFIYKMKEIKQLGGVVEMKGNKLFPRLKHLVLQNMENLEELGNGAAVDGDIEIMPCLVKLLIYFCPKLKSLPQKLLNHEELANVGHPLLSQLPSIPKLKSLEISAKPPQGFLAELKTLDTLEIIGLDELTCIPEDVNILQIFKN